MLCGSVAYGQPVVNAPAVVTGDLDLPPDREVLVREYIIREPAAPVVIEGGGTIRPGSLVPDYVPLRRFENIAVPSLRAYGYFVSPDNKVVIVDPASRQVVRILSQQ
ncbi:MAG: hypothetical protein NVSMB26_05900 [Beijerinckiaceae bacterium]